MLGRGGMGVVYRASQIALDRPVALKVIAPERARDASFRERFLRESRLAASIDHPNVVPVHEAGEETASCISPCGSSTGATSARAAAEGGWSPSARPPDRRRRSPRHSTPPTRAGCPPRREARQRAGRRSGPEHVYLTDFGLTKQLSATRHHADGPLWVPSTTSRRSSCAATPSTRAPTSTPSGVSSTALTGQRAVRPRDDVATMWAHLSDPPPARRRCARVPLGRRGVGGRWKRIPTSGTRAPETLGAQPSPRPRRMTATQPERSVARGVAAPARPVEFSTRTAAGPPLRRAGARGSSAPSQRVWPRRQ